ncbi:unnamed protein product, partial [Polarella glacialis]
LARRYRLGIGIITYNAALSACAAGSGWDSAAALLGDLRRAGIQPDILTCNSAMKSALAGSRWRWALRLLSATETSSRRLRPDVFAHAAALDACRAAGVLQPAPALLAGLRSTWLAARS